MALESLANVFKGGRISGWVERNRQALEADDYVPEEIQTLDNLSPSFAKNTSGLSPEEKAKVAREALKLADQSPLSATNYRPTPDNPNHLVKRE